MHDQRNHSARRRSSATPVVFRNERAPATGRELLPGDADVIATMGENMRALAQQLGAPWAAEEFREWGGNLVRFGERRQDG